MRSAVRLAVAVFLAAGGAAPRPAAAHPHAWIDVTVEVHFDSGGKMTGLRQAWLFDEFYTAYATEGFDRDHDGTPDQDLLDKLRAENLRDLAEYDYFTRVSAGGRKVSLGKPVDARSQIKGARLEMAFFLPLTRPAPLEDGVEYAIFDPTFYIEMLHAEDGGEPVRMVDAPPGCSHHLVVPSPSAETVTLAQALDRTRSGGDGLGIHFAERVQIRCGR